MLNKIKSLVKEEQGQGMTEYGLLLAAVVVVVLFALIGFKDSIAKLLQKVGDQLKAVIPG